MSLHEERDDQTQKAVSAVSSCVSLKSTDSMREPPALNDVTVTSDPKYVTKTTVFRYIQLHFN